MRRDQSLQIAALLLLLFLNGCTQDQDSREAPDNGAAPHSTASSGSASAASTTTSNNIALLPPLRRTVRTIVDIDDSAFDLRLESLADIPSFDVTKTQEGALLIRAQTLGSGKDVSKTITALMEQLGFKPSANASTGAWTASVAGDETARSRFNASLSTQLQKSGILLSWAERNRSAARLPGRIQFKTDQPDIPSSTPVPGKLVYTGQPLDVAFADTANPHWFIAVKVDRDGKQEAAYLRGGRLFVSEDNTIGIEQYALGGEPIRVGVDTQQVTIHRDGRVVAYRRDGTTEDAGKLPIVRLESFQPDPAGLVTADARVVAPARPEDKPLRDGHLEFSDASKLPMGPEQYPQEMLKRYALERLTYALSHPTTTAPGAGSAISAEPLTIHADLPWSEHHLKALGISVEHSAGQTVITTDGDVRKLSSTLAKVLQVLRRRLLIHDQNLRNADKVRDADGRLNPYRRKVLTINAQGDPVEGDDPSPFPKTYKLGDPNADAEGFVVLPNVNRAVELSEFLAGREEYKLIRAAAERLDPRSIFPDPPSPP